MIRSHERLDISDVWSGNFCFYSEGRFLSIAVQEDNEQVDGQDSEEVKRLWIKQQDCQPADRRATFEHSSWTLLHSSWLRQKEEHTMLIEHTISDTKSGEAPPSPTSKQRTHNDEKRSTETFETTPKMSSQAAVKRMTEHRRIQKSARWTVNRGNNLIGSPKHCQSWLKYWNTATTISSFGRSNKNIGECGFHENTEITKPYFGSAMPSTPWFPKMLQ